MSHQIFGEKENIFGYSDLKVQLYYTAGNLVQFYDKTYQKVISNSEGGIDPDDIEDKVSITIIDLNIENIFWNL